MGLARQVNSLLLIKELSNWYKSRTCDFSNADDLTTDLINILSFKDNVGLRNQQTPCFTDFYVCMLSSILITWNNHLNQV